MGTAPNIFFVNRQASDTQLSTTLSLIAPLRPGEKPKIGLLVITL